MNMTEEYLDIEHIESALIGAENMIAHAKESMDEEQINNATKAMSDAKEQLSQAKILNMNHDRWTSYSSMTNRHF